MSGHTEAVGPRGLVLADLLPGALVRDVLLVGGYAGLIGVSAQLRLFLPITEVPITGQTFAVLLGAAVIGSWRGAAGSALYLGLGLAGVPWFAAGSPVSYGYIVGFIVAAGLVGWLAERGWDRRPTSLAAAMVVGNVVIYVFGVGYLAWAASLPLWTAVFQGAVLFFPGDAIKIALAMALVPTAWTLVRRVGE
ncbi:MAG: biotin transporter BioY [Nitriliruptorales bacterium]